MYYESRSEIILHVCGAVQASVLEPQFGSSLGFCFFFVCFFLMGGFFASVLQNLNMTLWTSVPCFGLGFGTVTPP